MKTETVEEILPIGEVNQNPAVTKERREKTKRALEVEKKEDARLVVGEVEDFSVPNGQTKFMFRKHLGESIKIYNIKDGQRGKLPSGVARHLKENCCHKSNIYVSDRSVEPSLYEIQGRLHETKGRKRINFSKDF